tara:strand:- start:4738 stop:4911 length:174 start_codon:yes stop_codon:yes gene_type:complete
MNNQRILELQNKNFKNQLLENCKSRNIKYENLFNLGFQRFAEEELESCLKRELKKYN